MGELFLKRLLGLLKGRGKAFLGLLGSMFTSWASFFGGCLILFILYNLVTSFSGFFIKVGIFVVVAIFVYTFLQFKKKGFDEKKKQELDNKAEHALKQIAENIVSEHREDMNQLVYQGIPSEHENKEVLLSLDEQYHYYNEKLNYFDELNKKIEQSIYSLDPQYDYCENAFYAMGQEKTNLLGKIMEETINRADLTMACLNFYSGNCASILEHKENLRQELVMNYSRVKNGVVGEERVLKELELFGHQLKTLTNIRLEVDGNSIETDFIILSEQGFYSVEVKNFAEKGEYTIRITRDGQWQKIYNNGHTEIMKDVVSQVNRHIAYKEKFVRQKYNELYGITGNQIHFRPLIVIGNDNVMIENESDMPVVRVSQIYHLIKKEPQVYDQNTIQEVATLLEKHNLPAKQYPAETFNYHVGLMEHFLEDDIPSQRILLSVMSQIIENAKNDPFLNDYLFTKGKQKVKNTPFGKVPQ